MPGEPSSAHGIGECSRRYHGEDAGAQLGANPINRTHSERGTLPSVSAGCGNRSHIVGEVPSPVDAGSRGVESLPVNDWQPASDLRRHSRGEKLHPSEENRKVGDSKQDNNGQPEPGGH